MTEVGYFMKTAHGARQTMSSRHPVQKTWLPEISLIERAKGDDPEVFAVPMGATRTVEVAPGEAKQIFTHGLGAQTAVMIASKQSDGKHRVTLSHQPSIFEAEQVSEIRRELSSHAAASATVKHAAVIVTPGDWVKREGKWNLEARQRWLIEQLTSVLENGLPNVSLQMQLYSEPIPVWQSRALILKVPAEANAPILYRGLKSGECGF
jgi:hypothetical protein